MEDRPLAPRVRRLGAALLVVAAFVTMATAPADGAQRTYRAGTACSARLLGRLAPGRAGTVVRCERIARNRYRWTTVRPVARVVPPPTTTAAPGGTVTPPPTPAPPETTAAAPAPLEAPVAPADWAQEMLANANAARAAAGVAPLAWCAALGRAAQAHTLDQIAMNTMTHTGSDGSNIAVRADRAGYLGWRTLGENVAYGYPDVAAVMSGWMNSAGHRANLLNPMFTHVGFGRATGAYPGASIDVQWWTQDFGAGGSC